MAQPEIVREASPPDEPVASGAPSAGGTGSPASASGSRPGRIFVVLLVVAVLVLAGRLVQQERTNTALEAQVARLEGQVARAEAMVSAHEARLDQVRQRVGGLVSQVGALEALVDRDVDAGDSSALPDPSSGAGGASR